MAFLYTLSIYLYGLSIKVAALFMPKAAKWVKGRSNWRAKLDSIPSDSEVHWFHFASLGEFEQGRPIMEALRKQRKDCFLLISFFSPSGYEIKKNYEHADLVCYLPLDTPANASYFIKHARPHHVYFIKYEFWFNYLRELKKRQIPTFLISGIFRKSQHFFKPYGSWFRKQLSVFEHFFLQNQSSVELLRQIGYNNASCSGDSRFDRVLEIAAKPKPLPMINRLKGNRKVMVIGSNWPEDDAILITFINAHSSDYFFFIAPHNIHSQQLKNLQRKINGASALLSEIEKEADTNLDVLIIDAIGFLSSLYSYGDIAYIGGGFGKNVHNVLEAAVYGIPCLFGPNYHKFQECHDLIAKGGAFVIQSAEQFNEQIAELEKDNNREKAGQAAKAYVISNSGATAKIMEYLAKRKR